MEVAELREGWVGVEFDATEFKVTEQECLDFALACGEVHPRYTDPSHPDFQAPPTLPTKMMSRRMLPKDFPNLGRRGFDAGKSVQVHGVVRPGETLTGRSRIADIYEKTGRSGQMIFVVHQMEFRNESDELVAVVDWRMVRQPDPES